MSKNKIIFNEKEFRSNLKQAQANFKTFKGDSQRAVKKALLDTGEKVLQIAKPNVPVVEGNLKSSGDIFDYFDTSIEVGYNTDYATKVNYVGKSKGYFTDVVNANTQNFINFTKERYTNHFF